MIKYKVLWRWVLLFITTIHDIKALSALKEAGAKGILVGIENLSIRGLNHLSIQDLYEWKKACDKYELELYVNAMKLMMDSDLEQVRTLIQTCLELKIDGIYCADEGVIYLGQELGYSSMIYQPETLITNHWDAQFYLDQGCKAVSLAHELSIDEIRSISKANGIEILVSGYFSILYSRRSLVTNYLDAIHKTLDGESDLYLIEQTRYDHMPIVEDETGTHIFSEHPITSIKQYQDLQAMGIKRFRIDSLFKDDAWTIDVLNAYKENRMIEGSDHWYYQNTILKKEDPQ